MDLTVDRFYYVFDSRKHRTQVLDRTTGEEVQWHAFPRVQLIDYVTKVHSPTVLRDFARACALNMGGDQAPSNSPTGRLWAAAQGKSDLSPARIRHALTDAIVRAVTLGLPAGQRDAARLLAVHACTHPDPMTGAIDAAHMHERWAEFSAENDAQEAVRRVRQAHVDWLLDVLGSEEGVPENTGDGLESTS